MALLEVAGVEKRFGGLQALAGVSFTVEAGEIVGLIGPNGAGKTTLFHLLSGFIAPDAGTVSFAGTPVTGLRPHALCLRGLARTFQIVKPFPGLTALENVRVGALVRRPRFADAHARAREILQLVGLGARADLPARALTLAERKRLELARALATEPKLLLLDEVMAGLNATETGEVVELCRRINAGGVTILLIEHVMRAVMSLSRRILVLSQGQLIASGPPAGVAADRRVIEAYLGEEYVGALAPPAEPPGADP
jgi:branched-chain amino acid transport system ATP-binding protein